MDLLYKKVEEYFADKFVLAHDFLHAKKVAYFAKLIAKEEGYDQKEAEVAGLLHDVGRAVEDSERHGPLGVPIAKEMLDKYTDFSDEAKQRILYAIEVHSQIETFNKLDNILQDADKIDGMGAIGVVRAVSHKYKLPAYTEENLKLEPSSNDRRSIYHQIMYQSRWIKMFYTKIGYEMALRRHKVMEDFLKELDREIEESK